MKWNEINGFINTKKFDSNAIKTGEKSHTNIFICCNEYMTSIDWKYVRIYSVNSYTFFAANWIDSFKKLMEIYIER